MQDSHRFGRFEVRPRQRLLLADGQALAIGSRAFDLLLTLIGRRDELVTKTDLMDAVWPRMVVEENNLVTQIGTLRKLLGAATIVTIPGRGYRFAAALDAPNTTSPAVQAVKPHAPGARFAGNTPLHVPVLYGRSALIEALEAELQRHALVSLVGAGGIGKTRVAQAVAHDLRQRWPDGVWIVEVAPLTSPESLASLVAQLLGVDLARAQVTVDSLASALALQSMLLVLDNCEHLLDAVSELVRAIMARAPNVNILVTSQEPLRLSEEQQVRVPPLAVPPAVGLSEAKAFGAIELFEARVRALFPGFALTDDNLSAVIDICRALDGLPLAIELAAARVPALGVTGVRDRLDDKLKLLTIGWRAAVPRHRTLRATLEWSHCRLSEDERAVFRRSAVFSGGFSSDLAILVAGDKRHDEWDVLDLLGTLVEKSLVVVDPGDPPRYRLLESTRAYAAEQLAAAGEADDLSRRHARAVASLFERIDTAHLTGHIRSEEHLSALVPEVDNLRAAMRWATGEQGDLDIATSLAASVAGIEDCGAECSQWLLALAPQVDPGASSATAARFWLAFARPIMHRRVSLGCQTEGARRAVRLLRALGFDELCFYALLRLVRHSVRAGDAAAVDQASQEARRLERPDCPLLLRTRLLRSMALVATHRGESMTAIDLLRRAVMGCAEAGDRSAEALARNDLADVLWMCGSTTEAAKESAHLVDLMRQHPPTAAMAAMAWGNLTGLLCELGRTDEAAVIAHEGLTFMRRSSSVLAHADTLACLLQQRGQLVLAARLLGSSDAYVNRSAELRGENEERAVCRTRAALLQALGAETFAAELVHGSSLREEALAGLIALALESPAGGPGGPVGHETVGCG